MVETPVATTRHVAPPDETLLPMKTRSGWSVRDPSPLPASAVLLTGTLSPVRVPWLTVRSLETTTRRSAGIMSPAATCTTSPTTSSPSGISLTPVSARSTLQVTLIMSSSSWTAASLWPSWKNRRSPEMRTMVTMMMTVAGFLSPGAARMTSVTREMMASTMRMPVNGSANDLTRRFGTEARLAWWTTLEP